MTTAHRQLIEVASDKNQLRPSTCRLIAVVDGRVVASDNMADALPHVLL